MLLLMFGNGLQIYLACLYYILKCAKSQQSFAQQLKFLYCILSVNDLDVNEYVILTLI